MALTKNLANCTPEEFLVQSNKIRKSVERWLKITDVIKIRRDVPQLVVPDNASSEELKAVMDEHKEKLRKAARSNLSRILDAVMEEHPKETLEVLALLNFVEPENVNDYRITDYLKNVTEILSDEAVIDFFTSLMRLERNGILSA